MSATAGAVTAPPQDLGSVPPTGEAVGRIIVGHTTDHTARIWVQASSRYPIVKLRLQRPGQPPTDPPVEEEKTVLESQDHTVCFDFNSLDASSTYEVVARFTDRAEGTRSGQQGRVVTAVFRTFPRVDDPAAESFSFLLGSCNLSVVAINNLAAQALQLAGFYLARRSLERPISERRPRPAPDESRLTRFGRWLMRWRWARRLLGWWIKVSLALVFLGPGGKWSKQPLLRSPFLKLAGMFAGYRIEFRHGRRAPQVGDMLVGRNSGETGTLAFEPVLESGSWDKDATGVMILIDTGGRFQPGEWLRTILDNDGQDAASSGDDIAQVGSAARFLPEDLTEPAFTIHAGDQIYYDFPRAAREPQLDSYRDTYREGWFEDRFQRFFLARGSHYMTMDDHEIVDGFARDLVLPEPSSSAAGSPTRPEPKRFPAESYLAAARPAYQEYVHSRHPDDSLYYRFCHGAARFFVMDTRTCRRRNSASQMIDADQMKAFKEWLKSDPEGLKFVVSSVPFVAEVVRPRQTAVGESRENDKWCGWPFRWQRDEIIDFIDDAKIERVVFLVGDMHCAYHASMSIGSGLRWTRRTVHELAGGPINQLEFGRQDQFASVANLITRGGGLPYQVRMHQFHGNASAVMHIQVTNVPDPRDPGTQVPGIVWRVIRTMTDPESLPDPARTTSGRQDRQPAEEQPKRIRDHPPIAGRITLGRRWEIGELPLW